MIGDKKNAVLETLKDLFYHFSEAFSAWRRKTGKGTFYLNSKEGGGDPVPNAPTAPAALDFHLQWFV